MFYAVALQAAVVLVAGGMAWQARGWTAASAALYGGAVALGNSAFLVWRWWHGLADERNHDGRYHLKTFHRSSMERFFVVVSFLATGLFGLKLMPLPLLTGFIVGLLVWVIAVTALKTK
jgi:ATP synthase protein I